MEKKYSHLLSPLRVNDVIIRNRMGMSRAVPCFASGQDIEKPLQNVVYYAREAAKNGAAIVTVGATHFPDPERSRPMEMPPMQPHKEIRPMPAPSDGPDFSHVEVQILYGRIAAAIHSYGSLASVSLMKSEPFGWSFGEIPEEYLDDQIEKYANICLMFQDVGFDAACFYMSYRNSLLAKSLSKKFNTRTDKYGGESMAERASFSLAVFRRVKELCGKNFLVEAQVSGEDPDGGYTPEELAEYAKLGEGLIDIMQIRDSDMDLSHPIGYNSEKGKPRTLKYAEIVKKAGSSVIVAPVGGFQDPELNDRFIAENKADMIYMARAFICDSEYGKKIEEGRGEDVVPCIRCNKCHSKHGDPYSGCSVNPGWYFDLEPGDLVPSRSVGIKVAVIGGGPSGIAAAIYAAEKGHDVTLYEKNNKLGGQMLHADYSPFKWPIKDYKDYQIRRLMECGAKVELGIEANAAQLKDKGYDAIIYAAGAEQAVPQIPGVDGANVWLPQDVYSHEAELGRKVVVIGGSETGTETGLYLAACGHDVVVTTRQSSLFHDNAGVHYATAVEDYWKHAERFSYITFASVKLIDEKGVIYADKDGAEHRIEADSVVVCGGVRPLLDGAEDYYAITSNVRIIGDCRNVADIRSGVRAAYTAAMTI